MATTSKGHIERLPSGSLRVKVYAGKDSVTGKERVLRETCPAEAEAAAALARLLRQADGNQAPSRNVLFGQVLDKYLEVTDLAESTLATHRSYITRIIRPVLGKIKARQAGVDTLDALNAHLKRCSRICARLPKTEHHPDEAGQPHVCDMRCGPLRDHRTTRPHSCDQRCTPHRCTPLKPSSRVKVLSIVSAALSLAKRYKWVDNNVAEDITKPGVGKREPDPPTPEQAAALLNLVFTEDEEFGLFLWNAFTIGGRRASFSACGGTGSDSTTRMSTSSATTSLRAANGSTSHPRTARDARRMCATAKVRSARSRQRAVRATIRSRPSH
jgi:hypothetical protein